MGKKRGKDKGSREDDDIDIIGPSCRHIKKGTDQSLLKKLSGSSDWTSCQECKPEENEEHNSSALSQDSEEEKETPALWMCLKCGHRGCGRNSENQHAIKHYETPRSDPHCLVVSLDNWSVWCYICDDEVQYSRTGHLAQLLTNLKKQTSVETTKRPQKKEDGSMEVDQEAEAVNANESVVEENKETKQHQKKTGRKEESVEKPQKSIKPEDKGGVSVKGLSNLGNTCFFNAVIQNLSQTHHLRQILNKVTEEKQTLHVNLGASSDLELPNVELDPPGSLTLAMCQLLNEIPETKKSVVTPQALFTQICKKAARFRGFQQQDSQELLRYLLDGMRAEEIKRVKGAVTDALKESQKGTDAEQLKTLVQEYEKHRLPKNFVDQVFGGEMTSTVMCQQCKTVSVVTEMFLDLSLPVSDEAYRKKNSKKAAQKTADSNQDGRDSPALTNGNDDDVPSGAGSKYQQKKAKKQAKKQAKHQKRQQKFDGRVTLDSITSPGGAENEQTDDSADLKEGLNGESETLEENTKHAVAPEQNTDTVQAEKEEDEDSEMDSSATSTVNNRFTVLSNEQDSKESTVTEDKTSDMEEEAEEDAELASELEKVKLDDAFIDDADAAEQAEEPESKEYIVVNQDPELAFKTLAARTAPEKQECSVQSCLFQFTEVETLTQNNSLLCVTCTKRHGKPDKAAGSKKNVYTDALKQMLISSLPPVLTLHLKRFQQNGYSICKVNRLVQFPMILDLAPFCGLKCKDIEEGETQILYSLYGVVEHRGTMRSGHYTAYVKVRREGPNSTTNGLLVEGKQPPPPAQQGSWFHVSDTSVTPVSESKVESCQAYLLFYERIL